MHFFADDAAQALIALQPEDIIDMVLFAPGHQFFTAEAGIGSEHIFTSGQRSRGWATTRFSSSAEPAAASWLAGLSRAQHLIAGEDAQRQVAVDVVVTVPSPDEDLSVGTPVEEPLRLISVERDVGCIQAEHDLLRHRRVQFDVEIGQQPVDGLRRVPIL